MTMANCRHTRFRHLHVAENLAVGKHLVVAERMDLPGEGSADPRTRSRAPQSPGALSLHAWDQSSLVVEGNLGEHCCNTPLGCGWGWGDFHEFFALPKLLLAWLPPFPWPVFHALRARSSLPREQLRFPHSWVGMRGSAQALIRTWSTKAGAAPAYKRLPDGLRQPWHVLHVAGGSETSMLRVHVASSRA